MLRGNLVELRAVKKSDLKDQFQWRNDQVVSYWATGGSPFFGHVSMESLEIWYEKYLSSIDKSKGYVFSVYTLDDKHIGMADYRDVNYITRAATIGITIGDQSFWGKGYGTDGIQTLVRYLMEDMNLQRIQLDTWSGNERAIKSYEKCGFQIEGRLRNNEYVQGRYYDTILMGLLKDQ